MTPNEHYAEAEQLLQRAKAATNEEAFNAFIARAQTHAAIAQAGFIRDAARPPSTKKTTDVCTCGHMRVHHVYETGACRPGVICQAACREFEDAF